MQHLDEGTIHSWLDGALSPEAAAEAEAHVASCGQCAAAVAEARGFIAASSRILTHLDNAPRGVVPVAAPRRRFNTVALRAAAAVLVVAVGSLVVLRNGSNVSVTRTTAVARVDTPETFTATSKTQPLAASQDGNVGGGVPPVRRSAVVPQKTVAKAQKTIAPVPSPETREAATSSADAAAGGVSAGVVRSPAAAFRREAAAIDEANLATPLRQLSTERIVGGSRTTYAVSPSDTVTLVERQTLRLQSVVTTGVAGPQESRAAAKAGVEPTLSRTRAAAQTSSQSVAGAPSAAPPATLGAGTASALNQLNTVAWTDSTSGKSLTLSGRLPVARLEEIKHQIQRERAAAKKTP
ncbi:MAG: zf-HC2 domain-containing protein [Gemmatimonadaceae bacterium]